jgi:exosortase family protein XrtG
MARFRHRATPMTVAGVLLAFLLWVALLVALWRQRRWLPFYVLGALGGVVLVVIVATLTGLDGRLEALEARNVLALANLFGMKLVVLGSNGLAIRNHTGWGVFDVGVECSGLMEMAAMAGLVLFYPAVFSHRRKAMIVVAGTTLSYLFNLIRILLIVEIVARMGTDWVFPAHAVFGRLFFFLVTIAMYWRLVTLPTVLHIGRSLAPADE